MLGRTRKRQLWESSHTVIWYLNFVSKYVFARFFSSNIFFTLFLPWIYCLHFSPDMPFYLQICFTPIKFQFVSFAVSSCNLCLQQEWWKLEWRIPYKNEPTKALNRNSEMLLQRLMWYCRSIAALFLPVFCKRWFLLHTSSATSPKLSKIVISNRPNRCWYWKANQELKSNWI